MHLAPLKPETLFFSNSTGLILASHATSQGCLVTLARFNTASSRASFLGVQPSECQKYTEKTRIPPCTFTQAWVILPSLPGIDATAPSFSPTTVPKLLSTAIKTPPDVCLRSSLLALSSVILAASAANSPSFLGLSVELLLHFFLPQSVLNPKEDIALSFVSSHVLPLCAPR